MHKNVFTLPVCFTGSYTEDETSQLPREKSNFTEKSCLEWTRLNVNFKDFFMTYDREIKYFSRT